MSVWSDMEDRGVGELQKKEDLAKAKTIFGEEASVFGPQQPPITLFTADANGFTGTPQEGDMAVCTEDSSFGYKGQVKVYNNGKWYDVGIVTQDLTSGSTLIDVETVGQSSYRI